MIGDILFFAAAVWFNWFLLRLLYIAATRGYVMAFSRTIYDVIADPTGGPESAGESPQTRTEQPFKFWANVIVALLLFPLALAGLVMSSSTLWVVIFH